jgi:cell division protein FtsQ
MQLVHPDQVHISGNHYVEPASVLEIFAADRNQSLLRIPLEERRRQLQAIPWVAEATVRRALPNTLEVDIVERTPIAFLREGSGLSLIDIHGVILEKPLRDEFHFPVVTGIRADMPIDDREERMHLFAGFLQGIDAVRPAAADQVSEVDLADDHDLCATLTGLQPEVVNGAADSSVDDSAPLLVHFGDGDFQSKYQTLLEKIGDVRAKLGPVESIDLRFDGELVADPQPAVVAPQPAPKPATARAARHSH